MSSRAIKFLRKEIYAEQRSGIKGLEKYDDEEEEEEEEEEFEQVPSRRFSLLDDDDHDDDDDDDNNSSSEQEEIEDTGSSNDEKEYRDSNGSDIAKDHSPRHKGHQREEEDDDESWYINNRQTEQGQETEGEELIDSQDFFKFDIAALDMQNELKSRFGGIAPYEHENAGGATGRRVGNSRAGQRRRIAAITQLYARKCILGAPSEEWTKPPTFVGGGLRLVHVVNNEDEESEEEEDDDDNNNKVVQRFAFEYSPAFEALNVSYERVQKTLDPNALAIFLAHHPHFAPGLLTLALVLAQQGQMERAHELVRQCLFIYEASYCQSFKPTAKETQAYMTYRMDFARRENSSYFSALFRHMQMTGAKGLYRTAFEVAKFLLSLDPTRDPLGVLLCIDYYAVQAGRYDELLLLRDSGIRIVGDRHEVGVDHLEESQRRGKIITVAALPNIVYSCALALFHQGKLDSARSCLEQALLRFPLVLEPLIEKSRQDLGSRVTQPWGPILRHAFFARASSRLQILTSTSSSSFLLEHITQVYVKRSAILWESVLDFLFDTAYQVLRSFDSQAGWDSYSQEESQEIKEHYFEGTPISKYRHAVVADYSDEYPRLPPDLNPLDPALADPAIARRLRLNMNQLRHGGHQDRRALNRWQQEQQQQSSTGNSNSLNPELPLLELFWRSLLPWNRMQTR